MGKVRIIYKSDGRVNIVHPVPASRRKHETEEDWYKRVLDKATPPNHDYDDVDSSTIPSKKTTERDAWEGTKGQGIKVNVVKAQEIKDARIRKSLIEEEKKDLAEQAAIDSLVGKGLLNE